MIYLPVKEDFSQDQGLRKRNLSFVRLYWATILCANPPFIYNLSTKYDFHIYFTSFHCTGRYELNKLTSLPMCGFTVQLVEHCTGVAEVTGSNPVEALIIFRLLPSNCLNWKIYCDGHSSLSSTTAVQNMNFVYISQ